MSRTTVHIDPGVLRDLKRLQIVEEKTLGVLVSELLADALHRRGEASAPPTFTWTARPMGALIALEDPDAVQRALDDPGATA